MDAGLLYTKEILDYERSCKPSFQTISGAQDIKRGHHLHWKHIGSWRDGIVTRVDNLQEGSPSITMIRYGYVFPQMVVREETWQIDFQKDSVYRYDYGEHCHPPSAVVSRARACIGYKGYNALRNNNDDFCRWCMAGKHTYLCVNETVLDSNLEISEKDTDETFKVVVGNLDEVNQGDHITWARISLDSLETEDDDGWRHGIVLDNEENGLEVLGFKDTSLSIGNITFTSENFTDYKLRKIVYRRCHLPEVVLDRAQYIEGKYYLPVDSKFFASWTKTGFPQDSEAIDTVLIEPKLKDAEEQAPEESPKVGAEFGKAAGRTAAASVARGVEGAVSSAARQVPRVLVRGAAEGAAAAAAVGVEAVVLAVDVGLTYRNFKRRDISKDELLKRNIQTTARSIGAAGASIGGGVAGAAIGSLVFPGIGTIVGGIIGGVVGGISGQVGGHFAGKGIAIAAQRPYDALFMEDLPPDN